MPVTDEHVATLRILLSGNVDEHERLLAERTAADRRPYGTLVIAGFCQAVEQRFGKDKATDSVIDFVARVRARSDGLAAKIDPMLAERIVRGVYTDEPIDDIDTTTRNSLYVLLLPALVIDEQMNEAELDQFLAVARKLADTWLS
jgi:hypothetical protein